VQLLPGVVDTVGLIAKLVMLAQATVAETLGTAGRASPHPMVTGAIDETLRTGFWVFP